MNPGGLIGETPVMNEIFAAVRKVAPSDAPVLILGDPGVGKTSIAEAICELSPRAKRFLEVFDCGAVPKDKLEGRLFGYLKGAFAGAHEGFTGPFEKADGGTVILEGVGALDIGLQVKLLRFLQEKTFEKVGSSASLKRDVRILATSSYDLMKLVSLGKFREDLYYRLGVVVLYVPPLRKRIEDVPILADFFLKQVAAKSDVKKVLCGFTPEAMGAMMNHHWPGNVRELENQVHRAYLLADSKLIGVEDLNLVSGVAVKEETIEPVQKPTDNEILFGKVATKRWNMDDSAG